MYTESIKYFYFYYFFHEEAQNMNKAPNVLNPKTAAAINYWNALSPAQRFVIMRQIPRNGQSVVYWQRRIIKALEQEVAL